MQISTLGRNIVPRISSRKGTLLEGTRSVKYAANSVTHGRNNPSTKNHVSMSWFMSLLPIDGHYAASLPINKGKFIHLLSDYISPRPDRACQPSSVLGQL